MNKDRVTKITEWSATGFIMGGATALSAGFPSWSSILFCIGSILWIVMALFWDKISLAITNAFLVMIYVAGWSGVLDYIKFLFEN